MLSGILFLLALALLPVIVHFIGELSTKLENYYDSRPPKIVLSNRDAARILDDVQNPPPPNENAVKALKRYKEEITKAD